MQIEWEQRYDREVGQIRIKIASKQELNEILSYLTAIADNSSSSIQWKESCAPIVTVHKKGVKRKYKHHPLVIQNKAITKKITALFEQLESLNIEIEDYKDRNPRIPDSWYKYSETRDWSAACVYVDYQSNTATLSKLESLLSLCK